MNVQMQSRMALTMSQSFRMLRQGVGFISKDGKSYEVFSHEGDHLGDIPRYIVLAIITYVKRRFGIQHGTIPRCDDTYGRGPKFSAAHPPVTYGWTREQNRA